MVLLAPPIGRVLHSYIPALDGRVFVRVKVHWYRSHTAPNRLKIVCNGSTVEHQLFLSSEIVQVIPGESIFVYSFIKSQVTRTHMFTIKVQVIRK